MQYEYRSKSAALLGQNVKARTEIYHIITQNAITKDVG